MNYFVIKKIIGIYTIFFENLNTDVINSIQICMYLFTIKRLNMKNMP